MNNNQSAMERMTASMERIFLPVAHKISSQRHLSAIKDGFIATMPLALVGAIATMLNNVFFGSETIIGELLNRIPGYSNAIQPIIDSAISPVMSQLWWGTIAVAVIFSTFTIAYNLAKNLGEDGLIPGIIAVASYMVLTPQSAAFEDGGASFWGAISWTSFNSQAVFAGLITALLGAELYCWVKRKGWIIKMPDSVPPSVSKAFSAVIPAGITLTIVAIVSVIFLEAIGTPMQVWINEMLQTPLVNLGQSPVTMVLLTILAQFLWFFGLHGMNITEPALNLMYTPTLNANMEAVAQGLEPVHAITRNFIDVYGMHGGSGSTLALIIAIFIFSKKPSYRTLAKMSVAPGIFQINEPIIFGLPMVMNVILFIPFVLVPTINLTLAWFFTAIVPFAGKIYISVPWTTPPVVSAFLATGGDIPATILAAATLVIAIVIYAPFVIMANKETE